MLEGLIIILFSLFFFNSVNGIMHYDRTQMKDNTEVEVVG